MYNFEENNGIMAIKKNKSPTPITLLIGFINFLFLIEKYKNKPDVVKIKNIKLLAKSSIVSFKAPYLIIPKTKIPIGNKK